VVSNMLADAAHPERGSFVRDQVAALRQIEGVDVQLHEFPPGPRALAHAARELRQRFAGERFDVVHAHFGLAAWPCLALRPRVRGLTLHGSDVHHPRTRLATAAVLPSIDVLGAVSAALAQELPGRRARRRAQVLPCGVDVERFHPLPRAQARAELGLDPARPYVLFPADPDRPEKRYDRALELARQLDVELLTLGGVEHGRVPLFINAASAVIVPSEREGFGLAVLEALACEVPVLATPVGIHEEALKGVEGALCAPFELARWSDVLASHLRAQDPRIEARTHAARYSTQAMAARVVDAWRGALAHTAQSSG